MTDQQGVNRALYQLASRSVVDSEYELAIKCLIAVLENQPDPDDFAHCSLDLARIYIEHTEDSHKAQERLLQLHVRIKDHAHRLDQKCSCCSLLVKAAMKAGDGPAASKACTKAMKILGRARGTAAELHPWWLHFGCQAASMAQLNAQDWHKLANKALSVLSANIILSAQVLCAILQAQLTSSSTNACVDTLRSLQETISRWPPDPGPQAREIQAHALTLQALLMVRESQAGACWDIPLCTPKQAKQEAGDGAGTSQGNPAQNNGAASQANSADTVGPALSAVLDELQQVQNLTETKRSYGWLSVRSHVALIMLLRAADVLRQNSAGKDGNQKTAIFYAEAGLELLKGSEDIETNPTLIDLRVLLESISFLYYITAFSGKANEGHLASAQKLLAQLQSRSTSPGSNPAHPPKDEANAARTSKATAVASNATPPTSDAHVQPCSAATAYTRYCTAVYAVTMGEMRAAALHLRHGLGILQSLQNSNGQKGVGSSSKGAPRGLLLLSVLLTTTLCNALSNMGTAEAQAEVSSLLTELQSILEPGTGPPPGGKLENFLTAMARARSLRAGTEASSYLDQRAPRWQEHKDVVLQVSSQFMISDTTGINQQVPGKHQQLVISALRTLGPVLASEGDASGVEKVMKHALQLLNVAPDGTARVAVLRDYVTHCLPEDSDKRVPALTRIQTYSDAVVAGSGPKHALLLKWGLDADDSQKIKPEAA